MDRMPDHDVQQSIARGHDYLAATSCEPLCSERQDHRRAQIYARPQSEIDASMLTAAAAEELSTAHSEIMLWSAGGSSSVAVLPE